ncbi:MAG: hypothetical protein KKF68_03355 [Nanoarchaeota archaeon]|nr:hypothetical protein [Nanoarchaeota archaeon]
MKNDFSQRKQSILSKLDKSSKKSWDKKITLLCKKINSSEDYYTTSSCSGRVVLMINQDKKEEGLFLKIYHDLISYNQLKEDLIQISKKNKRFLKFKQEPCILHVACKNLESAQKLYALAKLAGWKKSGIISSEKRFIVELNSTERLEFPIIEKGKILVDDSFLKIIVRESNSKLKKSWNKVEKLEKLFN